MLKILTVHHTTPDVISQSSILFENLSQVLKNRTQVRLTWLVYKPEKIESQLQLNSDIRILDIHDFKNAIEIIQHEKPDIIYALVGPSVIDYAFTLAAQFSNIPVVTGELDMLTLYKKASRLEIFRLRLTYLFQNKLPTDKDKNQKRFMKRFRFFIYKHLFLLRTLQAIKLNGISILGKFFNLLKFYLVLETKMVIEQTSPAALHFLFSEMPDPSAKAYFKKSSLVVTGNPTFDNLFQRLQQFKSTERQDGKIRILLVTANPHDPGGRWRKKLRDSWLRTIITEITKHKDTMSLVIKIHPAGESLSEYQSLVNTIDSSIPVHQKGDILDFLAEADVIISSQASTALTYALIAKKPIIIWNFANVKEDAILEHGLALECKEPNTLVPLIHQILSRNPASPEKVEGFIQKYFYKADGLATERIANAIMKLLEKNIEHNTD